MRALNILRRLIGNSDRSTHLLEQTVQGVSQARADLGVMIELQKAELVMQRDQTDAIHELTAAIDELRGALGDKEETSAPNPSRSTAALSGSIKASE
jgi:hypothetical protein